MASKRLARPVITIDYGKIGRDDAADLADHLTRAGFASTIADAPSTDVVKMHAGPHELANLIEVWLPPILQGLAATLIWEAVKWAISKARNKLGAGDGREIRVHVFNATTETFITVNETGVWKTEKIPTEPKALPPRPPSSKKANKPNEKKQPAPRRRARKG